MVQIATIGDLDPRKKYARRLECLRSERTSWMPHWRDLSSYIQPRSGRFLTTDRNKGTKKNGNIISSTGTFASRTLQAGMMAGITSPARPWFRLVTSNRDLMESTAVKIWLRDVEKLLFEIFAKSNFYKCMNQLYGELGTFGTANMAILEDFDDVIRCQVHTIGSYMLAISNKNIVDTMYREFDMQVGAMVTDYGTENVSERVREYHRNHRLDEWITVVHLIEPNPDFRPNSVQAKDKAFISKHYEVGSNEGKFLRESGFDEFPNLCPRWETTGNDIYGSNCPGMTALGDIKQLQSEVKMKGKGIARMVDPPMVGPTSLRGQGASTLPGTLTYIDTTQGAQQFTPVYQIDPKLRELTEDIREIQESIRTAYFSDLFLSITNMQGVQPRNVEEIASRNEEKLLMLGPVLDSLNNEVLDRGIDRTFNIADRAGILPLPPQELEGSELNVDYISVLAQAQKSIGVAGIQDTVAFGVNLAGAEPSVLDKIDFDQALDEYAEMVGTPPKIVRSDEDVAAIREEKARRQQIQNAMQAAQQAADTAKTASEVDTEGKNLLTDINEASVASRAQ